ncbi:MAG: restriction endonuclease subunit S [Verrucomicrobiae bacterium]
MIENLQPYSEYKESGQDWLGRVPASWRTPRIKTVLREKDSRSFDGSGLLLSLTRNCGLIARSDMTDKAHSARTLAGYKLYEPGEIVMNRMQAWSGMFGAGNKPGLVSPDYAVFKLLGPNLVNLLLARIKAPDLVSQFALESKGIGSGFNRLYSDKFGAISISLPPHDDQAAIVRFLDHANRKIEGFIRAKRKLIGLLNEQKQAIIHRAVTRGLNPNVPLKPSGIPWLGDIPKHWKRTRLKFEASHIVDCLHATPSYRSDGVFPAIRTADIEPGKVRLEQARRISEVEFNKWTARLKPEAGDILYSREGERFGIAANVPPDTDLCISQRMMVFRIRERQNSEYLMWQLNCQHVYLQASLYVIGSTAPHVNVDQIKNFQLALPLLDEQQAIVQHISEECGVINTAVARTEREIALMQEYRTRLTADIVTGKLDVREAARQLPFTPSEPELAPDTEDHSESEEE